MFAVCTNCSRVSHNLLNCDKCGRTLSADNESECYSAEPSSDSNSALGGSVVNDESVVIDSSANATVLSRDVTPTPQGLFVNKSVSALTAATDTGAGVVTVQPQAPSVNRDNRVHTAGNVSASDRSIATRVIMVPSTATNHATMPAVNTADSAARLSHPSVVSEITSLSSDHCSSLPSATNGGQLVSSNHQSDPPVGPGATTEVTINAYQIRIGTRKFVPISPVSFTEDGIRFKLSSFLFLCNSPFSDTDTMLLLIIISWGRPMA